MQLLEKIREILGPQHYNLWFKSIEVQEYKGKLRLKVPNYFYKKQLIEVLKKRNFYYLDELEFVVLNNQKPVCSNKSSEDFVEEDNLNPNYTFENFIEGESNRFAVRSAKAICSRPFELFNPFFVWGDVGIGKTHLIQAIGNYFKHYKPVLRVKYVPAKVFLWDFIYSIQEGTKERFFDIKYKTVDVLLFDDIEVLAGKVETQKEFFHIFNLLYQLRKQIIITSDRPPSEIPHLEERLSNRLCQGLVVDIQPPEYELRVAILSMLIKKEKIEFPQDVIEFLTFSFPKSIRELIGAFTTICAFVKLQNVKPTLDICEKLLKRNFLKKNENKLSVSFIKEKVCEYFKVPQEILNKNTKEKKITLIRHIIIFLIRELLNLPLVEIGKEFGRNHSSVIHAYNKIKKLIQKDVELKSQIEELKNKILTNQQCKL